MHLISQYVQRNNLFSDPVGVYFSWWTSSPCLYFRWQVKYNPFLKLSPHFSHTNILFSLAFFFSNDFCLDLWILDNIASFLATVPQRLKKKEVNENQIGKKKNQFSYVPMFICTNNSINLVEISNLQRKSKNVKKEKTVTLVQKRQYLHASDMFLGNAKYKD